MPRPSPRRPAAAPRSASPSALRSRRAHRAADVDPGLLALQLRCLAADGGLPLVADPAFLLPRWGPDAFGVREDGVLVAAGAVRRPGVLVGLVDPAARGRGLGSALLDHGLASARASADGAVVVESEGLTPDAERLFASRGLRQVFAEDVLRLDLADRPAAPRWPDGAHVEPWNARTAGRFHAVQEAAFRDRPGFVSSQPDAWTGEVVDDTDGRTEACVLATLPGVGDAGFVTAGQGWVIQVGVVPAARGRGLGRALVLEAARRLRSVGDEGAWLCVEIRNPAARLYRDLGFVDRGRRARFSG